MAVQESRQFVIVFPVFALKNFPNELGFSKPQKSAMTFIGMSPRRKSSFARSRRTEWIS